VEDDWPEITSALTGYAAATPATDGKHVVAFFGSAGAVCCDLDGRRRWRKDLGDFESELGIASSPVIYKEMVILVCDHDGDRFNSFDSYLIALDLKTGDTRWKTERRGLHRSWSTPIVVPAIDAKSGKATTELIVAGENELRGYDPDSGAALWSVSGLTSWVAPSPVFGHGLIFAASGKDGPTLAVRPGGRGDVTETHVVWSERRGAPYVSSPLVYGDHLYTATEGGVVTCRDARTGTIAWRRRLEGRFFASPAAGGDMIYLAADSGKTFVLAAGAEFELRAENDLGEEILASPALSGGSIFLRTRHRLYCIEE
jgi:outer membrane protein assembly factor BamB